MCLDMPELAFDDSGRAHATGSHTGLETFDLLDLVRLPGFFRMRGPVPAPSLRDTRRLRSALVVRSSLGLGFPAMLQGVGFHHVTHVASRAAHDANQARTGVHADVGRHVGVPLAVLSALVNLRPALPLRMFLVELDAAISVAMPLLNISPRSTRTTQIADRCCAGAACTSNQELEPTNVGPIMRALTIDRFREAPMLRHFIECLIHGCVRSAKPSLNGVIVRCRTRLKRRPLSFGSRSVQDDQRRQLNLRRNPIHSIERHRPAYRRRAVLEIDVLQFRAVILSMPADIYVFD